MKVENQDFILYEKKNRVGYISLNKPPANGYEIVMLEKLTEIILSANDDKDVKVIVVRSLLEKFFCAGSDIKVFANNTIEQNKKMVMEARKVSQLIDESPKIFVAAINGHALGGGLEIAMACDIRIASDGEYLLGLPEIKLGLIPGNGGTIRLIHMIGSSRAMELLATGDSISPKIAFHYGLVNRLYDMKSFNQEVSDYAEKLASGPAEAMAFTKNICRKSFGMNLNEGLTLEKELVDKLYDTKDAKEGFKSFIEKRKPKFE